MGQLASTLTNKTQVTLPSDIEKNPREQVLAVEAVNHAIIEGPLIKPLSPICAYVPFIPFTQRLQRQPKKDQVQGSTAKSEAQLLEITMKKNGTKDNQTPTMSEEQVVQFEDFEKLNQEK